MSHLAPQAAIFSPSIARAAASTAKDWAYVDAWLRRQWTHIGNKPPSFERNSETLEVLLSLIAANEEADEERDRLVRLEAAALDEIRAAEREKEGHRSQTTGTSNSSNGNNTGSAGAGDAATTTAIHGDILAEDLLQALDAGLTKEGQTALDALADVSLSLNAATDPSPSNLSRVYLDLQGAAHETSHLLHRVELLQAYLDDESARLQAFLEDLRDGVQYQIPPEAAAAEDMEKEANTVGSRIPEMRRLVESLEKKVGIPALTVEDVRLDEEAYRDRLVRKKDLDAQVKAFAGLPPDVEAARTELESLRAQLREATERRDANFEMLVERESPVKVRTSRRF
ncbi:hypothetical protein F5Y08DRAFT_312305 [Xylaria arbuscula]|nr:hypothetical protein F5Y08DRAFT_312305 [Xylaria arbuscula]